MFFFITNIDCIHDKVQFITDSSYKIILFDSEMKSQYFNSIPSWASYISIFAYQFDIVREQVNENV